MRKLSVLLVTILFSIVTTAQAIKGRLMNEDNKPLNGVTITVKESAASAISNADGVFELNNLKTGRQIIAISHIGFLKIELKKDIKVNETVDLGNIEMNSDLKILQTVEIVGRKEKTYKNTISFIGSKTSTALKDLPQSVSYVTKELMLDQAAMRVGDVVKNFSGVNQFSFYDDVTIRGFRVQGGEGGVQLLNGLRTTSGFWKQPLSNFLERVEVIKGPSGALFGNASPGGTINRVTKKPLAETRQSLSFSTGSFNTLRALADFTGPFNHNQKVLYRLNIGYENAQSFRNLQFDKNYVIAPSVSFIPNDKTKVNFDLVYNFSDSRLDRGQAVFGDSNLYSTPISKSLNQINDYLKETNYTITTSLAHQFTKQLGFNASFVRTGYEEDLLEHRSANTNAKDINGNLIPTLVEMQVFNRKRKRFVDNLSIYFTYAFNISRIENKIVVGYDYGQEMQPYGGSQSQANGYRNNTNTGAAAYKASAPSKFLIDTVGIDRPVPNVAHFDLTSQSPYIIADISKYFFTPRSFDPSKYYFGGGYLQDQIKLDRFQLLLGVRVETFYEFENYLKTTQKKTKTTKVLPRVGLVYTASKNINLYVSHTQSFQPQTAAILSNPNAGGPFKPQESNLIEFGAKTEWLNRKLVINTSIYKIQQHNTLYNAGDTINKDLQRQIGKEVAKGFEIDVTGNILPNWNIMASYAYNKAVITESNVPKEIDRQKPNAPRQQGNVWTKYVINRGSFKGIGLGIGSNFVTERFGSIPASTTKEPIVLPGYTLLNAAVYYQFEKFSVQLNINNLTNKTHWVGGYDYLRLFPGSPRSWLATVGYTF